MNTQGAIVITRYRAGLALGVMLFAGSVCVAQGSHSRDKAKSTPLIDSIQGPDLYKAYCASCHGVGAKGDGVMTASLKVKPSDLTRIAARNGGTFPLMRMERIISGEELPPAGHGSSQMPVWGPIFSHVERDQDLGRVRIDNLARYLRDIQVK
jgi:mono/diheme cytochrome c family protein